MMNVMLYTHDQTTLANLSQFLSLDTRFDQVLLCKDPALAWKQFVKYQPDAVFLGLGCAQTDNCDGLMLAEKIRRKSEQTAIVFLSADASQALDAYRTYPLDFILTPIQKSRFFRTLDRLFMDRITDTETGNSTQSRLSIQCFGHFTVTSGYRRLVPIRLPTKKCRELLAFLLAHTNQMVSKEIILENLFDGRQDKHVINQLHVSVYQLRKALHHHRFECSSLQAFSESDRINFDNGHDHGGIAITGQYQIQVEEGICDLVDFVRLTRRCVPISATNILEIEGIAARYSGSCFEFEDYPWAGELRAELEYAHEQLLIRIAAFHESQNQTINSEQALKTLIHLNPYSEDGNHALLDLYLRRKDQRKFIRQYETYQNILQNELDTAMDERFQRAYRTFRSS